MFSVLCQVRQNGILKDNLFRHERWNVKTKGTIHNRDRKRNLKDQNNNSKKKMKAENSVSYTAIWTSAI